LQAKQECSAARSVMVLDDAELMYRAMLECIETEAGAGKLSVVFVFHRGLRFTPNKVGAYY